MVVCRYVYCKHSFLDESFNFLKKEFPIPMKPNGIPFSLGLFILIEVFKWSTFIHFGL